MSLSIVLQYIQWNMCHADVIYICGNRMKSPPQGLCIIKRFLLRILIASFYTTFWGILPLIFPNKNQTSANIVINRSLPEPYFSQSWAFNYFPPHILFVFSFLQRTRKHKVPEITVFTDKGPVSRNFRRESFRDRLP